MEAAGKRYILHGSKTDQFRIWNIADLHLMSSACAEERLRNDLQEIAEDPYSFWFGGGDYAEFIGCTDKRFDPSVVADWVSVKNLGDIGRFGMECVRDLFWPIRHKCLGLLLGNHEKSYELKNSHESLHGWLCTEMKVPNLQYCSLIDVVFSRGRGPETPQLVSLDDYGDKVFQKLTNRNSARFRFFLHHGAGYATTAGGKLNRLVQFMNSFNADIYMCGHVHDHVGRKEPTIGANDTCTELVAKERLGVISGSYLKTYQQGVTTYGEIRGYKPVSLGAATVSIVPFTRKVSAEL